MSAPKTNEEKLRAAENTIRDVNKMLRSGVTEAAKQSEKMSPDIALAFRAGYMAACIERARQVLDSSEPECPF